MGMNKQELKERVEDYLAIEGVHDARIALESVLQYIDQLDEPEITEEQAWGIIADKKQVEYFREVLTDQMEYRGLKNKIKLLTDLDVDDFIKELAKRGLGNPDIEPPKTLQVIIKNYDSTVYKTEIPEDEAMKLIEGWKG